MTTKIADDFAAIRQRIREVNGEKEPPEEARDAVNPAPPMLEILGWVSEPDTELFLPPSSRLLIEAPEVPKTNDAGVARLVRELETQMADFVDQMHAAQKRADERFDQIEKKIKEQGEEMGHAFREILAMVLALKGYRHRWCRH